MVSRRLWIAGFSLTALIAALAMCGERVSKGGEVSASASKGVPSAVGRGYFDAEKAAPQGTTAPPLRQPPTFHSLSKNNVSPVLPVDDPEISLPTPPLAYPSAFTKEIFIAAREAEDRFFVDGTLSPHALAGAMNDDAFEAIIDALAVTEIASPSASALGQRYTLGLVHQLRRNSRHVSIVRLSCGERMCATTLRVIDGQGSLRGIALPGMNYRSTLTDGSTVIRIVFGMRDPLIGG